MDSFTVDTEFRPDDLRALEAAALLRSQRLTSPRRRIVRRLLPLGLPMLLFAGIALIPGDEARLGWIYGVIAVIAYTLFTRILLRRARLSTPTNVFYGKARFEFNAAGMHMVRPLSEGTTRWPQVLGIDVTATHLFLWIDVADGYAVPLRDLPAPMTAAEAVDRLRAFISGAPRDVAADAGTAAPDGAATVPVTYELPSVPAPAASVSPWRELAQIGRALALRPFDASLVVGRESTLFLLGAVLLAIWVPVAPLVYADELHFDWYSVPDLAWIVGGTFALAWLLARLMRPRGEYRRVLLLTLGALPIAIVNTAIAAFVPESWSFLLLLVFACYAGAYFELGLRRLNGGSQYRAVLTGLVATALFVAAGAALYVNPGLWVQPNSESDTTTTDDDSADDDDEVWARVSALQFGQQARIDAELARIAQHATPQPEVFFLGFAGNGRQSEFASEIGLAAKVVGARYRAGDRELRLVNDARDLERFPFATPEALRHALVGLGRIMDSEDVLFLAISSHGGEDGSIEISNAGMGSFGLGTGELADMLREAKIPHAVIVVSACYAGAFVPVLADENTTVITAAAADRTSFGCADDRDLTYFGEAFYRDALPGAPTLADAFETARHAIAERERQERMEPSEPQARIGALVEERLAKDAEALGR